jgi:hypothetical protein
MLYLGESDTVMALCDQWWISDKNDINKSRYLFLPLLLDPETGKVIGSKPNGGNGGKPRWNKNQREAGRARRSSANA